MSDTITPKKYDATDDDLPEIFWNELAIPVQQVVDPAKKAAAAVHWEYPTLLQKRQNKIERNQRRAFTSEVDKARRVFVRGVKREQMMVWIDAILQQCLWSGMSQYELSFFNDMQVKFRKYYPKVKWVTLRQYYMLKLLAMQYLGAPNVKK